MNNREKKLAIRIDIKMLKQMEVIRKEQSLNWSNLIRQFINEQIKARSK